MTGSQVFTVGLVAILVLMAVVLAVVWLWPSRVPQGRSVTEIEQRVSRKHTEMDTGVYWPTGYPHEAPDHPLGVPESQLTMQRHRRCRVGHCPRKTAAWRALVEAGKIRPDTSREY